MQRPRTLLAEAEVPMRDGVELATDVYRPPAGRLPALLHRTPYGRRDLQQRMVEIEPLLAVRAGFAVVFQDVRGRGDSGGTFAPGEYDAEDGADTVAWIRRQRWSDGRVAMIGSSYNGVVQFQAARARPEGLVAIAPAVAGTLRDIWHPGGSVLASGLAGWLSLLLFEARARERDHARRAAIDALLAAPALERFHALLTAGSLAARIGAPLLPSVLAPPTDPFWTELTAVPPRPLPAIHTSGWYDGCNAPAVAAYRAWRDADDPAAPQALTLGPWAHDLRSVVYPELGLELEQAPGQAFALERQLAFLRVALGLAPAGTLAPVASFVLGANRWHEGDCWPPRGVRPVALALAAPGALVAVPPRDRGEVRYRYDPRDPVPTRGGAVLAAGRAGPLEQASIERRADVLTFTSAPLERALELAGAPIARLVVRSSAPATDFLARLTLVRPDGASLPLAHGVWSGRVADLPALAPSENRVCAIDLGPLHVRLDPGMRLRLQVTSSCSPELPPNPNTGHDIRDGPPSRTVVAEQAVMSGPGGSSLALPVLGAEPAFVGALAAQ